MAEKLQEVINDVEDRDYAESLQEMERGLPVFGRITGMTDRLKEVNKELPFNFRQPLNVVKAMFRLEPGLYTLNTGLEEDIQIGFRIDSMEADDSNKVTSVAGNPASPTSDSSFYRNRILRLEGELHDADRKIRQQVDEIVGLKRELAEDKTATLLTHQKELSELRESHRNEIERLKELHRNDLKELEKELGELEKVKFRLEMEQRAGGRDASSRMLDMLEENAPMFFTVISQLFAGQPSGRAPLAGGMDISEEQAKALTDTLKKEMKSHPFPNNAHLTDNAETLKGVGAELPRHLPATDGDQSEEAGDGATINGQFATHQLNGHNEQTISL